MPDTPPQSVPDFRSWPQAERRKHIQGLEAAKKVAAEKQRALIREGCAAADAKKRQEKEAEEERKKKRTQGNAPRWVPRCILSRPAIHAKFPIAHLGKLKNRVLVGRSLLVFFSSGFPELLDLATGLARW